jgi:Glycosyl transferase family 8
LPGTPSVSHTREGAVVVCSDATWAWQGAFVLARSMAFDREKRLDHHAYLVGEVSEDLLSAFPEGAAIHRLTDYPKSFRFEMTTHVPAAAMLRLFALEELASSYRRVVYLDGDVFQAWGTLADVLALPETGRPLAAVRDRSHWPDDRRLHQQKTYVAALHPKIGENYFNSGMMVVNGPVWAEGQYSQAALEFFNRNSDLCRYGDQSALNAAVGGNWDSLSPGWNWQMSKVSYPLLSGRRPRLVHFTGPTKPWSDRFRLFDPAIFEAMKQFLQERGLSHLLDPKVTPDGFGPEMERRRMRELVPLVGDALEKRNLVKRFLDAADHVDRSAGIPSYAMAGAGEVVRPTT